MDTEIQLDKMISENNQSQQVLLRVFGFESFHSYRLLAGIRLASALQHLRKGPLAFLADD